METLTVGSKCFWDTLAGLVPAKVIKITNPHKSCRPDSSVIVTIQVISKEFERYGFRCGEIVDLWSLYIVPIKSVCIKNGFYVIMPYKVEIEYKGFK